MQIKPFKDGSSYRFILEHTVNIRRKNDNVTGLRGSDPTTQRVKIGSSMTPAGKIKHGLRPEEEGILLPAIIEASPDDIHWFKYVENYWADISYYVREGQGNVLDISLKFKTEEEALSYRKVLMEMYSIDKTDTKAFRDFCFNIKLPENGMPLNVSDYILWRYCLVYSKVANRKEDLNVSNKIMFYLVSKDEETINSKAGLKVRNAAKMAYLQYYEDSIVQDAVLRAAGKLRGLVSKEDKEVMFERLSEESPEQFVALCTDSKIHLKAFIQEAVNANILTKVANTEKYMYDGVVIGNNLQEVVIYLEDQVNVAVFSEIKAKIETDYTGYKYKQSSKTEVEKSKPKEVKEQAKEEAKTTSEDKKEQPTKVEDKK